MAALVHKQVSTPYKQCFRRCQSVDTITASGTDGTVEPDVIVFEEVDLQSQQFPARYVGSVGWLFAPQQTPAPLVNLSAGITRATLNPPVCAADSVSPKLSSLTTATSAASDKASSAADRVPPAFQGLPTEIHFLIAAYLPGHAISILSNSIQFDSSLREPYRTSNPGVNKRHLWDLSYEDLSIYIELRSRDLFESTPYPREAFYSSNRRIWSESRFYCFCCKKLVGTAHFPLDEMLENIDKRSGMSKITDRKCFAHFTPVQLWGKRVVTWTQLQDARTEMHAPIQLSRILEDLHHPSQSLWADNVRLSYTAPSDTLTLVRGHGKHEAKAKYYIDLYTPFRFRNTNGSTIVDLIKQNPPYICPHLSLAALLPTVMATKPIDFRPEPPTHDPPLTVADVLAQTMDTRPWQADPDSSNPSRDRPTRKIKQQAIWCGFNFDMCRTRVTLQRFRDNEGYSVGWCRGRGGLTKGQGLGSGRRRMG